MGQYTVKHQTDHTCSECEYYSFDKAWVDHCAKCHEDRVGWSVLACKDYKPDEYYKED